jgi:hypothetical protein
MDKQIRTDSKSSRCVDVVIIVDNIVVVVVHQEKPPVIISDNY